MNGWQLSSNAKNSLCYLLAQVTWPSRDICAIYFEALEDESMAVALFSPQMFASYIRYFSYGYVIYQLLVYD